MPPARLLSLSQGSDLFRQPAEGLTVEGAALRRPGPLVVDEPGVAQDLQVLGDRGLREGDLLHDVPHTALRAGREIAEHSESKRAPERGEHLHESRVVFVERDWFH